jgi:hypothetical protein
MVIEIPGMAVAATVRSSYVSKEDTNPEKACESRNNSDR